MFRPIIILLFVLPNFSGQVFAQNFLRVEAEFSIKEISPGGDQKLTIGKVYFDRTLRKIVYNIRFPEQQIIIVNDTGLFQTQEGKSTITRKVSGIVSTSVFNLVLNGHLNDFGLSKTAYELASSKKVDDMVISTWNPPKKLSQSLGQLLLSQKDKKLFALVSKDADGNISGRQFFEEYAHVNGVDFPCKVVQFRNEEAGETKKITTYKNVIINNLRNESWYNYPIPGM